MYYAALALGSSTADASGWDAARVEEVLDDCVRLHQFAGEDPAALADIDWNGFEALMGTLDVPPPSPSPSPDV